MDFGNKAMTLTFGDRVENHEELQMLGEEASTGFTHEDLVRIVEYMEALGYGHMCELRDLRELAIESVEGLPELSPAYLLVIRHFLAPKRANEIFEENMAFEWDKELWNWKKKVVQNRRARHNVCYDDKAREANYSKGEGMVVAWNSVPATYAVGRALSVLLGEKGKCLACEGNLYYDVATTGIGWHGDTERRKVVGIRLGKSIPLKFRWWYRNKSFGETLSVLLNHGDAYIMSEKAVGWDWVCPVKYGPTLRHSAGCENYTK